MELGKYQDLAFERELKQYIQARMPPKVFDAHVHLCPKGPYSHEHVDVDEDIAYWHGYMEDIVGKGRLVGGLMLPNIVPPEAIGYINDYTVGEVDRSPGSAAAMLVRDGQDPEEVEAYILSHPSITTLKPYMRYSSNPDRLHSRIDEFVPDWAWTLADRHRLSIMLHITRYKEGLSDPDTLGTVLRRCNDHPNMRLILAHCALAHNPNTLKRALSNVRGLENLYFDVSGIAEPAAICHVLDGFGPGKLLYASDLPFGSTLGRIVQLGSGLLGLDPMLGYLKLDFPMDYDCCFLPNAMEGLLALFTALDAYGVSRDGWEDIFYNNARWVFRIGARDHLPHRAGADAYDRSMRHADSLKTVRMGKGCEIWSGEGIPYFDTCSEGLEKRPLGYADREVGMARRGALLVDPPEGFGWQQAEELERMLLERHPWANQVVLTVGRAAAETLTAGTAGKYAVLGEELGNGAPIGAALFETPRACACAKPSLDAICAAQRTLEATGGDFAARLSGISTYVADVWENASAKYGVPAAIDRAALTFSMSDAQQQRFESSMREQGFIASHRFVPTTAHTCAILNRYAHAADRAFRYAAGGEDEA